MGRLATRKRVLPLLDILAEVRRRLDPDIPLQAVLAGDGPQLEAVRARARTLGIESWLRLPGRLTRPQVRELYAQADVFLAPAELESFGLAALEARCSGLPVVARSQAGVGEFIRDGVEGLLGVDDDALAGATVRLLTDPALLTRISRFNSTVPTCLGWTDIVDRCLAVYAMAGRQTTPALPGPLAGAEWSSPCRASSRQCRWAERPRTHAGTCPARSSPPC